MKNTIKMGFTLVELLVVITILTIISVVAYQNFGGATDKAISAAKLKAVTTIEGSLVQYKDNHSYYPSVGKYDENTNKWGYMTGTTQNPIIASPSNTIIVKNDKEEIEKIVSAKGGGRVMGRGGYSDTQIGAKGTISRSILGKKNLSKDLYDTQLGDINLTENNTKMIDEGIGRFVYAVYRKPKSTGSSWSSNKSGTAYNIAYTIKDAVNDEYITKIVGDYDEESCNNTSNCPKTLIGSGTGFLTDGQKEDGESNEDNYGVPYAVTDFAQN